MQKAILEIAVPEACCSCPCKHAEFYRVGEDKNYCKAVRSNKAEISDINRRPDWCPLIFVEIH
jgi:hypothetical protein